MKVKVRTYRLIESKSVFRISLLVIGLTVMGVYFWGVGKHNTFFENSIISTSILSIAFFLFITIGLFKGMKLKDNLGQIVDSYKVVDTSNISSNFLSSGPVVEGEGIGGVILSILLWIVMAIVLAVALWIFSNVLAVVILIFASVLYWVFFRALRLVFKNSNKSKSNLAESIKYGLTYTFLYNFWIYGIFILTEYFKK